MADYTPFFTGGVKPYTATTSAAVTGGQLLVASATGTVGPSGLGGVAVGVAAHDAASGAKVSVWPIRNCVHETATPTGAAFNVTLQAAATGQVDPLGAGTFEKLIGVTLTTAGAAAKVRWIGV